MRRSILVALLGASAAAPLCAQAGGASARAALTPRDSALHALNRLAYGPRPGQVEQLVRLGVWQWIERQLAPGRSADSQLTRREHDFEILHSDQHALARLYDQAARARRELKRDTAARSTADSMRAPPDDQNPFAQRARRLAGEFQDLAVVRATVSERQLNEVMVDFWANHFNVFFNKGADRFLLPAYIEETIRPRVLGSFEDLLIATAKSPAMLFYLDNWQSVAAGSLPPQTRLRARPFFGRPRFAIDQMRELARQDSLRQQALERKPTGLNENYARELLELHTLGVDGGYTQADVISVARILTGWSIERPQQGGGFVFNDWAHDYGAKTVMGVDYPAGHGMDEGIRLLKWLANHPATMHHVSRQLCQRLVRDEPPDGCVDEAVAAWKRSAGDIRQVVRAIVASPDFWARENLNNKVKTPLEFVVSALRAVNADPDSTPRLAQIVGRLGEPLYLHVAPDGYPEREEAWVNSGALLDRMNVAIQLATGRLPGVTVDLDAVLPATADRDQLLVWVNEQILGGSMTAHTMQVIRHELADVADPVEARALALGLAIGGPEFQRQ